MKLRLIISVIILLAVVLINSCEDKKATVSIPTCTVDTAMITYSSGSNTMVKIINTQCGVNNASCHAPGGVSGYDYSTYAGIYANYQNGLLYSGLFGSLHNMPLTPQSGWSDSGSCMLDKFKAWMDQGCPN
jgi:hypothetical protein